MTCRPHITVATIVEDNFSGPHESRTIAKDSNEL